MQLLFLLLIPMFGCWKVNPGPIPAKRAQGPIPVLGQQAQGPISWVDISVRAGSAHDPIGKEGTAWLTAQLLQQGGSTSSKPAQVARKWEGIGSSLQVVVDHELVSFRSSVLTKDLPVALDVLGDSLTEPRWDEKVFVRLKEQAQAYLSTGLLGSDEQLGWAVFNSWIFDGHPYGRPIQGRLGALSTLTLRDVKQFYQQRYIRASTVIGLAGSMFTAQNKLDAQHAVATKLEGFQARLSKAWPTTLYKDVTPRKVSTVKGRQVLLVAKSTSSVGIHFGHPHKLHRNHPDWPAMLLAQTVLGAHRQSFGRLYKALRTKRGFNYGDYAYLEMYRQAGGSRHQETASGRLQNPFLIWLRPVSQQNGAFALRAAVAMFEEWVKEGVREDEFRLVKSYLQKQVQLWAKTPGRRIGWKNEAALMGWSDPIEALPKQIKQLSRDQVNAAIQRHINPQNLKIVAIVQDPKSFRKQLTQETSSVEYSGVEPVEEQAKQDKLFGKYDLKINRFYDKVAKDMFR